jgi:hypothetical protein
MEVLVGFMATLKRGLLLQKGIEMAGNDRVASPAYLPTSFAYIGFMDVPRIRGV